MTARRVAWLLGAGLVVIAFAIWLSSRRHLERATMAGDPVLPGLTQSVNTVTQLQLTKGDGTKATIQKSGDAWSVSERSWPADVGKVRKLLLALGALNVVEEKTRLPANYPQLGVEDVTSPKASGTRVEVVTPTHTWALIVGKSSSAKSGYVRVAGAEQSLLAAPLLSVDADPKSWLENALIDLPVERVKQVDVKPAQGPAFSAARAKKEDAHFTVTPLPKGHELSGPGAADAIPAALAALTLDDVHKGTAPPDAHLVHSLFRGFDGLEVDVAGRKDGTRSLIAINAHGSGKDTQTEADKLNARLGGWEFDVPEYKYAALFTPLDELLKKPPEAAKQAASPGATKSKSPKAPAAAPH
jgi:hypothetical protein